MAAGLGTLRLDPRAFWAMTPRELQAALGVSAVRASMAPARGDLMRLISMYPDR